MYNRYIPEDTSYTSAGWDSSRPAGAAAPNQSAGFRLPEFLSGRTGLLGKDTGLGSLLRGGETKGLSKLLNSLHLDNIDSGDILLLLIILYLLVEGDDLELVIALGLVLLMGLGENESD